MKCGSCKNTGVTIEHVRACYGLASTPPSQAKRQPQGTTYGPKDPIPFPHGRYAVTMPDGKLHFFVLDAGKPGGRWEGYTFIKEQASDDLHPVRSQERRNEIVNIIAKNPEEAMLAYGRELGKCGHCGRTLTDAESRALGIGPVCRGKMAF